MWICISLRSSYTSRDPVSPWKSLEGKKREASCWSGLQHGALQLDGEDLISGLKPKRKKKIKDSKSKDSSQNFTIKVFTAKAWVLNSQNYI